MAQFREVSAYTIDHVQSIQALAHHDDSARHWHVHRLRLIRPMRTNGPYPHENCQDLGRTTVVYWSCDPRSRGIVELRSQQASHYIFGSVLDE
jgi:hypothetical protein